MNHQRYQHHTAKATRAQAWTTKDDYALGEAIATAFAPYGPAIGIHGDQAKRDNTIDSRYTWRGEGVTWR